MTATRAAASCTGAAMTVTSVTLIRTTWTRIRTNSEIGEHESVGSRQLA
jgi:hypothetical protein